CCFGIETKREVGGIFRVEPKTLRWFEAPYDLVRKMRASFFVLGPLVAKSGQARVSMPGGCAIGRRPVDIHIKALEKLGVEIAVSHGYVEAHGLELRGAEIVLDFPSVGATENVLMAATLAKGESVIRNAAREPEVSDLANFLVAMGAKIEGIGTDVLHVQGVQSLSGGAYRVIPDRIEAETFMVAGAMTGGDVTITDATPDHCTSVIEKLRQIGARLDVTDGKIRVQGPDEFKPVEVSTMPYPGFPTDSQAQLMALLTIAKGTSIVKETIFENRFMHVSELVRLGADITIDGNCAIVKGVPNLSGSPIMASDLRASAALILAGLIARGETEVLRVYHLDRGYEHIEAKLSALGANVERFRRGQ
ncbi:MAG TPA: UDP-N-acetylglucosamine 1-carboxyvinyltransferase, partial [bacterium]|nr:UDP-N-acetylglucosamine 1-carboxyvinyltransferase [bacterium]